ncbi:MAG TPA: hypothetical protein DCL61_26160 [Cyanobacteria bacterium UBA12227]|nr:hypothetical protein [Cyanobacteria bacterium UBA12227]HAX86278.1 hypothetical protein [Cyanobacteria bacterium UBA11370]HBY81204.1 hypothetical protein [Cyanobacteria bacterium UBA11148]
MKRTLLAIAVVASLGYVSFPVVANPPSSPTSIPTTTWNGVELPNWNNISFNSLPAIGESGSFPSTSEINQQAGYDLSRTWQAGQKPSEFLKLGDFETSFKLQNFSLDQIADLVGNDLTNLSLKDFGIMLDQSLQGLVDAIPELKDKAIASIAPVQDLLTTNIGATFDPNETIGEFLNKSPNLGELKLSSIDLSQYRLDSIPGLESTPIGAFENWQNSVIEKIPGLSNVSFSQFPGGVSATGTDVGTADLILKPVEQKRDRTISGSNVEGFTVPCQTNCAHIELAGSEKLKGRQWISGKYQEVKGGFGVLGSVNGGKEPTGIHPFGEAFKLVAWEVNENESAISTALFFRICKRGVPDLGCTPYFIGGVPWMTFSEKIPIFLGKVDELPTTSNPTNSSQRQTDTPPSNYPTSSHSNPFSSGGFLSNPGNCPASSNEVSLEALFSSLSAIEGNYNSIGAMNSLKFPIKINPRYQKVTTLALATILAMAGLIGAVIGNSIKPSKWVQVEGRLEQGLLSKIIKDNSIATLNPKSIQMLEAKGLYIINFNSRELCGSAGCLYAVYTQNGDRVLSLLLQPIPQLELFAINSKEQNGFPCLDIKQPQGQQIIQSTYCYESNRFIKILESAIN